VGQKVHPIGFRLGINKEWLSRWFARKSYADNVLEDVKIRKFLNKYLDKAEISKIEIEKAGELVKVTIHTARPGKVIGKKGQEIDTIRKELAALLKRPTVEVSVHQVKNPELDATLVAQNIASQLERRVGYKQAMKRAAAATLRSGAEGIKIRCAGRLAGAEIARDEWVRQGRVPLHTLRADIDYGEAEANTKYGIIGVKVWICRGDIHNK